MRFLKMPFFVLFALLLVAGCSKKADDTDSMADSDMDENPYAELAGDWMVEAYANDAAEDAEPLVVVMVTATDSDEGWSTKFTHLEDAIPATNIFMNGDSVVVESGSYASALRDGRTVESLTSYYHFHGQEMSGRFVATYDDGVVTRGKFMGARID
ncbi:MAG: hypothetical protein HKN43_11890 [Rhodothermales bacterium]|nr:hypothetical protein [Rhodothermales bacterium]